MATTGDRARAHEQRTPSALNLAAVQDLVGLWPVRVLWFLLPLAAGPALGQAVENLERPGSIFAEVSLWAVWFVGLVASLVPTTMSLTAIRVLTPAVIVVAIVAGLGSGFTPAVLGAAGFGAVLTGVCYLPVTGDRMINGSAYGSERRMALRPPGFALLGPVQLAWVSVVAGLFIGPWLLATGFYLLGAVAVVLGAGMVWAGFRVLHQLARRWIVFVPAGFVIHDHVQLVESILMRRSTVDALGPATTPTPDDATDLTAGAYGLALEAVLSEPTRFGQRVERQVVDTSASRLLFTPTLPGVVLAEARTRAVRIGTIPGDDPTQG